MMPVPTHLKECAVPKDASIDEQSLDATVQCSCGSHAFDLLFPGETHEYRGKPIPCTAEIAGKFFFVIKAKCVTCGKTHLLLDIDFHGWNGFVCHNAEQAALPRPAMVHWQCLGCGKTKHTASIQIQTQGKIDFVEEGDGDVDADRWPDGFSWFSMSIRCCDCGLETPEWISCETM